VSFGIFLVWQFAKLPVASRFTYDLRVFFWPATHLFQIEYVEGLYAPPWNLALLWPLTAWPIHVSRGLFVIATLAAVFLSVPRHKLIPLWIFSFLLVCLSHPVLRQLTELNIEFMLIFGALLLIYALPRQSEVALAGAALLLSAKIQVSWLVALVIALRVLNTWSRSATLKALAWLSAFTLPILVWKGSEWLEAMQSFGPKATDSSLRSVFMELGLPSVLFWIVWLATLAITLRMPMKRSQETETTELGLLFAAGLLLSPYASNISIITPLVLGAPTLIQKRPVAGTLLMSVFYLPYILYQTPAFRSDWENTYAAAMAGVLWAVFLWDLNRTKKLLEA
jgi:hypothetical protein